MCYLRLWSHVRFPHWWRHSIFPTARMSVTSQWSEQTRAQWQSNWTRHSGFSRILSGKSTCIMKAWSRLISPWIPVPLAFLWIRQSSRPTGGKWTTPRAIMSGTDRLETQRFDIRCWQFFYLFCWTAESRFTGVHKQRNERSFSFHASVRPSVLIFQLHKKVNYVLTCLW